jgi:hypothetical protein
LQKPGENVQILGKFEHIPGEFVVVLDENALVFAGFLLVPDKF